MGLGMKSGDGVHVYGCSWWGWVKSGVMVYVKYMKLG